jgi:hypothetical protein
MEVLDKQELMMLKILYEQKDEQGNLSIAGPCGHPLKCHKAVLTS